VPVDFSKFDKVLFKDFDNDVRDSKRNDADLYSLIEQFKTKVSYESIPSKIPAGEKIVEVKTNIDVEGLTILMASLREIKTKEELVLLKKACEISAIGQIEIMKAMHPDMSEAEIQGTHEFVYKKYNVEYEGYPSIVGVGNNGCVLHYIENTKMSAGKEMVLMDLGAEYHGYTADVTRTIPANGKFNKEQKAIYDLVYAAQEAGIAKTVIGSDMRKDIDKAGRDIINQGLVDLGIIDSVKQRHLYFPHGTSHHIGLDVHDLSNRGLLEENMIITVEPGIYIPEGSACDEKWWGIAVRIEDCILVTKNGPINFSGMAPRSSDDIEEMMKEESILNAFKLPNLD
jgi:Xaa-Pro aminopeptidase